MRRRKKRRKLPTIRQLEKKADKILSELIRRITIKLYGKCPLCMERPVQCCFHIVSRKHKAVRWFILNTIGACHQCNYVENYFPDISRVWFVRTHGIKAYAGLVEMAKATGVKYNREQMTDIILGLEERARVFDEAEKAEAAAKAK